MTAYRIRRVSVERIRRMTDWIIRRMTDERRKNGEGE
jgi:hypothetical protein